MNDSNNFRLKNRVQLKINLYMMKVWITLKLYGIHIDLHASLNNFIFM